MLDGKSVVYIPHANLCKDLIMCSWLACVSGVGLRTVVCKSKSSLFKHELAYESEVKVLESLKYLSVSYLENL